jgi:mRNA-degrading endonuclease RelE of RelBE toxin-antitoxin system
MIDKIRKVLNKLTKKEREAVRDILEKINKNNFKGLDVKKLKGRDDIFRVRKGKIRIIFRKVNKSIFILSIERKSDKTYRF